MSPAGTVQPRLKSTGMDQHFALEQQVLLLRATPRIYQPRPAIAASSAFEGLVDLKERLLRLVKQIRYGLQRQQILGLWPVRSSVDQQGDRHLMQ